MTKFPSFAIPTHVKNMQELDGRRILFGNRSDKHGPAIFDIDTGLSTEIMSCAELEKSIAYSYAYSPDGNDVYSSKGLVIEKSIKQDDGASKTVPFGVRANYVAGAMMRIFCLRHTELAVRIIESRFCNNVQLTPCYKN